MFTGNEQQIIKDLDTMSIDEARKAIASGQFGSVGRPDRAFASEILVAKEASERDKREAKTLSMARRANIIAIIAIILSTTTAIIAIIATF